MIIPSSYAWTSPYQDCWPQHCYGRHFWDLYGQKIVTEKDFRKRLSTERERPEIMFMGNFVMDRASIASLCRENGINLVWGEDGFFPHYQTMHLDPAGFCWEASLSRMVFRGCSDQMRQHARAARTAWLERPAKELPECVKPPYVLWPLQLIGDKVNQWDLAVKTWDDLIAHFRECLPAEVLLVVKEHPRAKEADMQNLKDRLAELPNTVLVAMKADLHSLLKGCAAVAGANSSVLYEARLMHHKPVYAYARSWFTHHEELFMPVRRQHVRPLPRADWIERNDLIRTEPLDEYADWFLGQLLARQMRRDASVEDASHLKQWVDLLSWRSFRNHGEDVFEEALKRQ